jgi:hypothetical protein
MITMRDSPRFRTASVWLLAFFMLPISGAMAASVLVEAESFAEKGGWVVDPQFADVMGSPFLMAHGLGQPVADAVAKVAVPQAGQYRVLVRTRNWVPGDWTPPGRFQVLVNGAALEYPSGRKFPWNGMVDFSSWMLSGGERPYTIPFRSLYSKNIDNLMMAGRCFSCSHVALGGPRIMNTTGQMGVAVGYAASLCHKHRTTPRGVHEKHLSELLRLTGFDEPASGDSAHGRQGK